MKDHDALLAAVISEPHDDLPRLALADWLDENGQPERAEFIRAQVELTRLPKGDERRGPLSGRESDLLKKHRDEWNAPLKACGLWGVEYRRGFAEKADIADEGLFAEHHERLAGLAPLREIDYEWDFGPDEDDEEAEAKIAGMLRSPAAASITHLEMGDPDGLPLLAAVLASPNLTGVTSIAASCQTADGGAEVARLVAGARQLKSLRSLRIWAYDTGDEGLAALANAPHLASLEDLALGDEEGGSSAAIGVRGVAALAESPSLHRLRWINLCGNRFGDAGATALAGARNLAALEKLLLGGCSLTESGLRALALVPKMPALRHLAVTVSSLSLRTVDALIASPVINRLDYFFLGIESGPDDTERGEELWRLHFGDEAYSRLTAHFGPRILCDQAEWYP